MGTEQRINAAHKLQTDWPGAAELLRGLAKKASELAEGAMKKARPDDRSSGDVAARTFVWHLGNDFHAMFGKALLGSLAKIVDVTFNKTGTDEEFSKSVIQNILRGI